MPKIVSLFSGAGGLDLGLYLAGIGIDEFTVANDILTAPAKTYCLNFGHTLALYARTFNEKSYIVNDIKNIDFSTFSPLEGNCIVVGGPPCQDFSVIRGKEEKRRGIQTLRGKLYSFYVKALAYLKPIGFIFENVPGLVSANKGNALKLIIESLSNPNILERKAEGIKYKIVFCGILNADNFGVPQKRKRFFIIGIREDIINISDDKIQQIVKDVFKKKSSIFSKFPLTPIEVFEGKPLPELSQIYKDIMHAYADIAKLLKSPSANNWIEQVYSNLTFDPVKDYLTLNKVEASYSELEKAFEEHEKILRELSYYNRPLRELKFQDKSNEVMNEKSEVIERMKRIPPGENYKFVEGTSFSVKGRGLSLIYRRIHPLIPSNTIVAYGGGGTWGYHYQRERSRLTNRERARLQTFPDTFLFEGTHTQVRAQIGEAVPPILSKAVAQVFQNVLSMKKCTV